MAFDAAKRLASEFAVRQHLVLSALAPNTVPSIVVGVGSGSTVVHCVAAIAQQHAALGARSPLRACVPTSFQARELILANKLPLGDLNSFPHIDVTFDGADEVNSALDLIKGGGGCHFQEKLVAASSRSLVIVADESKMASSLGTKWTRGVPLEVSPFNYIAVMNKVKELFPGTRTVLRSGSGKVGPVVTDAGNFVVDAIFESNAMASPAPLATALIAVPGLVETGLFCAMADVAYFGTADGRVLCQRRGIAGVEQVQ